MTNMSSSWTIESIEAAMGAESEQTLGHLTLGFGRAVLPSAEDGSPVEVPAAVALAAITQHSGECWVAYHPAGGAILYGAADAAAPEALPAWLAERVLGQDTWQDAAQAGLALWWHPRTGATKWFGVVLPDGRAVGVDAMDYEPAVCTAACDEVDVQHCADALLAALPAWAAEVISAARRILGV